METATDINGITQTDWIIGGLIVACVIYIIFKESEISDQAEKNSNNATVKICSNKKDNNTGTIGYEFFINKEIPLR
jgi:beta-lactamase regulating signal transducer with metallopeptidase domain